VGQLGVGGQERQLYYLLTNLDHARYQPAVVVWNLNINDKYYQDIEALEVPIYGFPIAWSPLSKLRALRALGRRVAPEIIHSYGYYTNFAAYYAAQGTGALAIGSLRSDFNRARRGGGIIRGALNARWPSCLIANSVAAAEAARRHPGPFAPRQVFVVRNGLDLNQFRCSHYSPSSTHYIAAVGSLLPVKRWDRLLRLIPKVKNMGIRNLRVRIAGGGPLRTSLERLAKSLDVSEYVEFIGESYDIPAFLRHAKFLVHTSESEGCPNVVMEAMASQRAVIAMNTGDISQLIEDGKTGFVVDQDEAAFADRVLRLLSDEELCQCMGVAAREKAERDFGLGRLVAETLAVYRTAGWKGE
jgi:glycosyltransferase involved in cell wall biosynthesis